VDEASQRPEEQNCEDKGTVTSLQPREMLNEEEDLTPLQMVYWGVIQVPRALHYTTGKVRRFAVQISSERSVAC
jgi:hypothetical protein